MVKAKKVSSIVLSILYLLIPAEKGVRCDLVNSSELSSLTFNQHERSEYEIDISNVKLPTCCKSLKPPSGPTNLMNDIENENHDYCDNAGRNFSSSLLKEFRWLIPSNFISLKTDLNVTLIHREQVCKEELLNVTIHWNHSDSNLKRLLFYPNGYLRIGSIDFYAPDEYCINGFSQTGVEIKACPPSCDVDRPCIPKCCPINQILSIGINRPRGGCKNIEQKADGIGKSETFYFNPPLYHDFHTKLSKIERSQSLMPHYFYWAPFKFKYKNCKNNRTTIFPSSEFIAKKITQSFNSTLVMNPLNFKLRKDGAFLYRNVIEKKCEVHDNPKNFLCIDGIQDFGLEDFEFHNSEDEYVVQICRDWNMEEEELETHKTKEHIYGIFLLTFSIFPMVTSGVYFLLWSRHTIHGWTIAVTTGCLFFMYLFHGISLLMGAIHGRGVTETFGCVFIAIISHFFFLATFSWMTVMSCDLWWTFWYLTPTNRRSNGKTRFLKFSAFGWGLPFSYVFTGVLLDFTSNYCTENTLPGYGTQSCSIIPRSQGIYIYYPVAMLLLANIIFFSVTCFKLCRYGQNTRFATKKDSNTWQCFVRFSKLFLVMGISWMSEIISWSIDGVSHKWYWVFFDGINILRAVGVFIVYVCKQDIYIALEDTHPCFKKIFGHFKRRCSADDMSQQTASTVHSPAMLNM